MVVTASAGNHAQGVAYHAHELGMKATIVMPAATPFTKVANTGHLGAEVVLHGDGYGAAYDEAVRLSEELDATFVPAFDDPLVIAGQGTVGLEIIEQVPDVDTIVVPIGGGGLVAGIAIAVAPGTTSWSACKSKGTQECCTRSAGRRSPTAVRRSPKASP